MLLTECKRGNIGFVLSCYWAVAPPLHRTPVLWPQPIYGHQLWVPMRHEATCAETYGCTSWRKHAVTDTKRDVKMFER